ncbi:MAG: triose-phosphate isomerase [Alphaproteobacteria bacterium]|nr:triose-phosphate isomerase [Alphaproteobacteria bacterium]
MRRKLIAGNWKMNGLKAEGIALAKAVFEKCATTPDKTFDILVCPPMNVLGFVAELPHAGAFVGAQDVAETTKPNGAFTGDISAQMVLDLGATWTLVGHSERRQYHHETDAVVKQKALNAIGAGLTTVICIGETLAEREAGQAVDVVRRQTRECVPMQATAENCVIAYEPVWAIGTGKVPTTADVAEIHAAVRDELAKVLGQEKADKMRILYGGSVKPENAKELLNVENVDGALIGGASLKADSFWAIAETLM